MFGRRTSLRAPGGRATLALLAALALVAILFSYLGAAVAGASPAGQAGPAPAATPQPELTPEAELSGELPAAAADALAAYLASQGAGLASAADQPVGLFQSFTTIRLPMLMGGGDSGNAPTPTPITPTPITPTPITPTPITPTPEPEPDPEPADVSVRLWSDPSIRVARGGTFVYELRVRNHGDHKADQIRVSLPYRRDQYSLLSAQLDASRGDWVTSHSGNTIEITFGRLNAGAARTGRLIFRAAGNLANDTALDMRATFSWDDGANGGHNQRSNWQPLLVGAGNASAPYVWTTIGPNAGPATAVFRVQSNRFLPGETVVTWLNTPTGIRPLTLHGTANGLGVIDLFFQDTALPRGNYQIVVYGQRSDLTGVASFTIQ